jgi:hypothetical protein
LKFAGEPRSRTQLVAEVKGKTDYVRLAIDRLVAEGFAEEIPGDRGARLVRLERPFRETDE